MRPNAALFFDSHFHLFLVGVSVARPGWQFRKYAGIDGNQRRWVWTAMAIHEYPMSAR
jgi:hypothetical protein